jgi:hypothetical protein
MVMDANEGGDTKIHMLKAILGSQVGGWIVACIVCVVLVRWISTDRNEVYQDLWRLRKEGLEQLQVLKGVAEENNVLIKQILSKLQYEDWRERRQEVPHP